MNLLSAWSISLDSTFKLESLKTLTFHLHLQKVILFKLILNTIVGGYLPEFWIIVPLKKGISYSFVVYSALLKLCLCFIR